MPEVDHQTQLDFEALYDKNQIMKRLKTEYSTTDVEDYCAKCAIPFDFGVALLSQMWLHKRTSIGVLVGILHHHFKDEENQFQACADMLYTSIEHSLIDYSELGQQAILIHEISKETQRELVIYQYPLPMLTDPAIVTNNRENGYYSVKNSIILKSNNHHDEDVCLDHINRANSIKLTINIETMRMVKNKWKDLDHKKSDESFEDYKQRVAAFEKFDTDARDVIDHLLIHGNRFNLTTKVDKRGRSYCQGYHISYQGNEWSRAIIEFSHQEVTNAK